MSNVGVPGVRRDTKRVWDGCETREALVRIWGLGGGGLGMAGPVVWAKPGVGIVGHLGVGVALWDSWLGRGGGGEGHWELAKKRPAPTRPSTAGGQGLKEMMIEMGCR